MLKSIGLLVIASCPLLAQDAGHLRGTHSGAHTFPGERSAGRPRPGTRGGDLATEYIATQLALAGAKPAGENGTYYQKVPLVGIETQPDATLGAAVWGKGVDFSWGDDFVGYSQTQRPDTRFEGEAVFVGHGITAPEFKWDDFKGRGRDRQGARAVHQRAAVHRSEILRRARADLLRPLGLQIRRGAAPRGQGLHHHPHHADGQLRLGCGAQFLGPGIAVREAGAGRRRRSRSRAG